jgi:hypothetical protein
VVGFRELTVLVNLVILIIRPDAVLTELIEEVLLLGVSELLGVAVLITLELDVVLLSPVLIPRRLTEGSGCLGGLLIVTDTRGEEAPPLIGCLHSAWLSWVCH